MLFNEPKLLKCNLDHASTTFEYSFSALQRAEIAEMTLENRLLDVCSYFSALQRAEIAEMRYRYRTSVQHANFSALQRAEIAEMAVNRVGTSR